MENSNKRHGKKSDKETQSPVLKVFKEMMQREKNDPEKANLLKEKQANRKRRYSFKSDRVQRSCDSSSCSEKHRRSVQYKVGVQGQRIHDYKSRSQSPFQGQRRDSWWCWCGDKDKDAKNNNKQQSEDTCSCVSCALKKIVNSEYTCIACLGVVVLITLIVAFLVLFKAVPMTDKEKSAVKKCKSSGSFLKKIDSIQKGYGDIGAGGADERNFLDSPMTRHISSLTGLHGNDFDDNNFRDLNMLEDSGLRPDSELSSILDTGTLNDGLSSDRLRNFYRKLIQTDNQIRNLKKGLNEYNSYANLEDSKYNIDRSKRSLRLVPKSLLRFKGNKNIRQNLVPDNAAGTDKFKLLYPPYSATNMSGKVFTKVKRFVNDTEEPTGYLVEKKQILIQYNPQNKKIVAKCSHAPKDSKSHEKQLKHPFYKNTQRLDEMLDQLLDKNIPELMADPFGVDILFKNRDELPYKTITKIDDNDDDLNVATKKPVVVINEKVNVGDGISDNKQREETLDEEYFKMMSSKSKDQKSTTSNPRYVLLGVSTLMASRHSPQKITKMGNIAGSYNKKPPSLLAKVPHIRKLLQFEEEDEEGLGYQDLEEVLADDSNTHDENEKAQERRKRMDDYTPEDTAEPKLPQNPSSYNPPGVHNPNWKNPMPLYPDELTAMIKQVAMERIHNFNKEQIPIKTKDVSSENDDEETDLSDVEYLENYSDNKFEKLAKMAQAYSDYGVLEGKKETIQNDQKIVGGTEAERRGKMNLWKGKKLKNALFNKFKKRKCAVSEGIRFEYRPTTAEREDKEVDVVGALIQKHIKLDGNTKTVTPIFQTLPQNTNFNLFKIPHEKEMYFQHESDRSNKNNENIDYGSKGVVYKVTKGGKRTPKLSKKEKIQNEYGYKSIAFNLLKKDSKRLSKINNNANVDYNNVIRINKRSLKSVNTDQDNDFFVEEQNKENIPVTKENIFLSDQNNSRKVNTNDVYLKTTNNLATELAVIKDVTVNSTCSKNNESSIENITPRICGKTVDEKDRRDSAIFKDNITKLTSLNVNQNSSSNMDLSDFFMLISNWFSLLAGVGNEKNATARIGKEHSSIMKFNTKGTTNSISKRNASVDIEYPSYDSDMVDNIGHRSRVLLALEDAQDITTEAHETNVSRGSDIVLSSSTLEIHKDIQPTTIVMVEKETTTHNADLLTTTEPSDITSVNVNKNADNKTIVKRNISKDNNLIFWNDMYDEEYGIRQDPIDTAIRDKPYIRGADFVRKSGNWIQDKMKNLASNFRRDVGAKTNTKRRVLRGAKYVKADDYSDNFKVNYKRAAGYNDEEQDGKPTNFAELTVKMKEVCKEAAKAVQQTKSVKVRQEDKEESMTSSLMQQLVRLMTDLVDFQVQQKTCVKLPRDLRDFLEWLTSPNPEEFETRQQKMEYRDVNSIERPIDQSLDLMTTSSSEKEEVHAESRSDCLGTLHAVQDLMQQYDDMTDEDKSKMTGIREYLENQLLFLNRQLNTFDDYKVSNMYGEQNPSIRYRRDLPKTSKDQIKRRNRQKFRSKHRFKRRFFKNFGKKHTRTTASIYDGFPITENRKIYKHDVSEDRKETVDLEFEKRIKGKDEKRNLKDVYYKALNDAKKSSTTFKAVPKDDLDGFDAAQIVRIEN